MSAISFPAGRPRDLGRVLFLPVCLFLVIVNTARLVSGHTFDGGANVEKVGSTAAALLTLAFYWLVIRAYLTRLPARATSTAVAVNAAALVATALPLVIPLLRRPVTTTTALAVGDGLLLAGLAWSVWSLRALGRSFSVIPQARAVVSAGPYGIVRHPLYLGEIVATLGLVLLRPSVATFASWLLLCGLQVFRASQEEQVLTLALPDYDDYRRSTRRLVPGIY